MAQEGAVSRTTSGPDQVDLPLPGAGTARAPAGPVPTTPEPAAVTHVEALRPELASWQRRLAAGLIDSMIIFAATSALWIRLFVLFASRMSDTVQAHSHARAPVARAAILSVYSQVLGPFLVELAATTVLATLYYWLLTSGWGTTIGKRCVRTYVASATDGGPPGQGACLVRAAVFVIGAPVLPFFIIDNSRLLTDQRRQCLHDKAAGTIVIRSRPDRTSACAVSCDSGTLEPRASRSGKLRISLRSSTDRVP